MSDHENEQDAVEQAVKQLKALAAVPGSLHIILANHRCCAHLAAEYPSVDPILWKLPNRSSGDPDLDRLREEACDSYQYPISHPYHNEHAAVTKVEGPNERGVMRALASTPEGTHVTIARPRELLARLLEVSLARP